MVLVCVLIKHCYILLETKISLKQRIPCIGQWPTSEQHLAQENSSTKINFNSPWKYVPGLENEKKKCPVSANTGDYKSTLYSSN
jgi:hypothetical protein